MLYTYWAVNHYSALRKPVLLRPVILTFYRALPLIATKAYYLLAVEVVGVEPTQPKGTRFTVWPGSPAPAHFLYLNRTKGRTRTCNHPGRNRKLFQIELLSQMLRVKDSNLQHPPCKGGALPIELTRKMERMAGVEPATTRLQNGSSAN